MYVIETFPEEYVVVDCDGAITSVHSETPTFFGSYLDAHDVLEVLMAMYKVKQKRHQSQRLMDNQQKHRQIQNGRNQRLIDNQQKSLQRQVHLSQWLKMVG